jgi:diguanylate cyclase (GGDEF)-like protein
MDHHNVSIARGDEGVNAFQCATFPMLIFDLETRCCVGSNEAATQVYGYPALQWNAVSLFDLFEVSSHALLQSKLHDLDNARPGAPDIVRQRRRDGSFFWGVVSLAHVGSGVSRQVLVCVQEVTSQMKLLDELSQAREHCALAQELSRAGHCVLELTRGQHTWSMQQCRNFGFEVGTLPTNLAKAVDAIVARVHEQDRARAAALIHDCIDYGTRFDTELRLSLPNGSERIVRVEGNRKNEPDGSPYAFVCTSVDLTEHRRTEESLRAAQVDLSLAQRIARIGTWEIDLVSGTVTTTSDEIHKLFGFTDPELPLTILNSRIHPDDYPAVETARAYCLANPGAGYSVQYRVSPCPGKLYYVESQAEVQTDSSGKAVRMVGYTHNVTEAKLAEQEIHRLAYTDDVTGLSNHAALRRHLERTIRVDSADFTPLALLIIDVARFEDLSLTLGQNNADVLLKEVSARIVGALGEGVLVARIGNSQFAAVFNDVSAYDSLPRARVLCRSFDAPFHIARINYDINVHIGIAYCPGHASDPVALMRKANVAVFRARQIGTDVLVYEPASDPYHPDRLILLGEFRKAIQDGQIELFCQPKVEMRTNHLIGVEALVRWRHPRLGMISPALFVPLIEETELIHVLTRHMLQSAVRQYFNWEREGLKVPLAVNVSPRNLLSHDLMTCIDAFLLTWGGNPEWLGIEITESSLITDPEASIAELTKFSMKGFRLFVDDFGTGYSSLSYLTRLPVNVIKVDHSFTMRMLEDARAATIVKSTIELAHNLGMTVVAEGTASKEIWDALVSYGCDEAQGFYVAKPFPANELSAWLKATGRSIGMATNSTRQARH